jgi:UDP:flavonoid glycosyltransferase YjiC (YdhE family)
MKTVLFYISGHGYGHVVRMSEVMRELRKRHADCRILARTQAPRHMLPEGVEYSSAEFDSGVAERETGVVMDEPGTIERLKHLLNTWDTLVATEVGFVEENAINLIVADIPPVAGEIAHAAGVPCIAISNFTWDWIYEPYAREHLGRLEQAYARMDVLLRLPFAQPDRLPFRRIVDAPLIARKSRSTPPARPRGSRIRALLGSRAQVSEAAFARASAEAPEFEFVVPPVGAGFPEALASCDLVIAKLGFSMLAESIAARKPMLYPPRVNFREEAILQAQVSDHVPAVPIPLAEFYDGNWAPYLRRLVALPPVASPMRTNGAEFCAGFLSDYLR